MEAWRVLAAASLGLAVLAKGPVACILFALVAGLAYWRLPDRRKAYRGGWLLGTIVFLAIVASWYVPAYLANGNLFVRKFLIEQNIGRFTGGDAAHSIGLWGLLIYPLVLLVGMFPWSIWGIKASGRRREVLGFKPHASRPTPHHFTTYLKVWFWVVFVFFTISGAKLPHYILPAVPPLAMLIAMRLSDKRPGWPVLAWVAAVWAIAQAGFSLYYYGGFGIPGFHVEVHRIARFVAASKEDMGVAVYKMGRQTKDMGTGKPKIQETSHPSILLYLNGYGDGTVIDTDQFGEILHRDEPYFVITRWNRIGPEEQNLARIFGKSLMRVETPFKQDLYALYEVRPK